MRSNAKEAVEARRDAWRGRLQQELNRMVEILKRRADVRRVILFGSAVRGGARWHSDLDLVIIQDTTRDFFERLGDMLTELQPRVPCDILVYTPEEWEKLRNERKFVRRINEEGVVLYEAERDQRSSPLA